MRRIFEITTKRKTTMASRSKTQLTLDDHVQLGSRLKALRVDVLRISMTLSPSMKVADVQAFLRSLKEVDGLRSKLDGQLARDFPQEFDCNTYYGKSKDAQP